MWGTAEDRAGRWTHARGSLLAQGGSPTPEGEDPHRSRCPGGATPSVSAAPAPPGASFARTPPGPRPGRPSLRRGPLPNLAAAAPTAARPAALLTSAVLRIHGRADRVSRRRGARGRRGPGTDDPQRKQRPPRAAGWRLAAPSRSSPVPHRGPREAGTRRQASGGGCGRQGEARIRSDASLDRGRMTAPRQLSDTSARSRRRGTPPRARLPCVTSARPGARD